MSAAKQKQLGNLLGRGRQLHWANFGKLARSQLRVKLPQSPSPLTDVVYRAVQLLVAMDFIERRAYLQGAALDQFGSSLFQGVAGQDLARIHGLVQNYAPTYEDEGAFVSVVSRDLSHAIFGKVSASTTQALAGTPRAMLTTTQLYCAQVFGDTEMMRRLA